MKKLPIILACLAMVLLLGAWGEKKVELLDGGKLIDLGKAIEFARPGGDSTESPEESSPDDPDAPSETNTGKVFTVTVRDREIRIGSSVLGENDNIEAILRNRVGENVRFVLVDDYAEAHAYRKVLKVLKELKAETGIEYSCE